MKLYVRLKRAKTSRIANQLKNKFNDLIDCQITVSENAPANMQEDGTTPEKEGWKEVPYKQYDKRTGMPTEKFSTVDYPAVAYYYATAGWKEIWFKTATLGGRSRMWVRNHVLG